MKLNVSVPKVKNKYEAVIIMHPDASEEDQKSLFNNNLSIIKNFDGDNNHLDTWGKRRLGNQIKNIKMGIYFHTTFEATGECIAELERTMHFNDKVLRYVHYVLDGRIPLTKHVESFRTIIQLSKEREQEREAKSQARRAATRSRDGGGRDSRGSRDGGSRSDSAPRSSERGAERSSSAPTTTAKPESSGE